MKVRLEGKMKKIINLSDAKNSSEELKDITNKIQYLADIARVYSFFLTSSELKDKGRSFCEGT
jgi:uncharacterized protein YecE (DUF72 family)